MADRVVIWGDENNSMGGGSWRDEIVCTRRKDGSFSLRTRKVGDDGTDSMAGKTRISSPEVFVQTLIEIGRLFYAEIEPGEIANEVCGRLDALDREFSSRVRSLCSRAAP